MNDPARVHVLDLRRQPGLRREVRRQLVIEPVVVSDVTADAEVEADLVVEAVSEGVVVEGVVRGGWRAACRRCLEPVTGVVEVDVREIYADREVPGELYPIDHDVIDLGPMVREAVALALPLAPLCGDDCRGPAPERFPAEVSTGDDEGGAPDPAPPDPRWAALDEIRFE